MADRARPTMAPHLLAELDLRNSVGASKSSGTRGVDQRARQREEERQREKERAREMETVRVRVKEMEKARQGGKERAREIQREKERAKAMERARVREVYGDDKVKGLRRLVRDACWANPSLAKGQIGFSQLSSAIEQHCSFSKARLFALTHGMGFKNSSDACRAHCSDLVNLKAIWQSGAADGASCSQPSKRPRLGVGDELHESKIEYGRKRILVSGTVEILEQRYKFNPGEIYEVVSESSAGNYKVFAGMKDNGVPKRKVLLKDLEGTLWRWKTPPVYSRDCSLSPSTDTRIKEKDANTDSDLLPFPWSQQINDDGVAYYFNEYTGESQWEKP